MSAGNNITNQEDLHVIAFKLGKEEYALSITKVQEIIMPVEKTTIPRSPEYVDGVINLRGNIIPIIDGRKRFGIPLAEETSETRIMVLELEDSTVGLTVDSVSEVIHIPAKDVQSSPVNSDDEENFILGIGKYNNRLIILLNPDNLLKIHEIEGLKSIAQAAENLRGLVTLSEKEKVKK